VQSVLAVRPIGTVTVVGRDQSRAKDLADRVAGLGVSADVGTVEVVPDADVVVCATTAAQPLFAGDLVADHACVVAVGSHEPDRRELDGALLRRAASVGSVVVETHATAMREAGDVVLAVEEGALSPDHLLGLADVVRRDVPDGGPHVFKSVGMGWEDLVVAEAVWNRDGGADKPQR
jgi:ornithine cyclodeaminase